RLEGWSGHARAVGTVALKATRGELHAEVPFVVEAWASLADQPRARICVNRTPVTAEVNLQRSVDSRSEYDLFGCGLATLIRVVRNREFAFLVNVQTPYMPITSDGKAPDLGHVLGPLGEVMEKAARQARRAATVQGLKTPSQKGVILEALPAATAKASGDGQYRFSLRQLFYAVRPTFLETFNQEP